LALKTNLVVRVAIQDVTIVSTSLSTQISRACCFTNSCLCPCGDQFEIEPLTNIEKHKSITQRFVMRWLKDVWSFLLRRYAAIVTALPKPPSNDRAPAIATHRYFAQVEKISRKCT